MYSQNLLYQTSADLPSPHLVIDESHVTLPQVRAMYGGDKSRKFNLVEHGFRLPAAMDNRPLKFEEFEIINNQTIYVSATPSDYELEKCEGVGEGMEDLQMFDKEDFVNTLFNN